ncbi:MAG: choice-of-anchor Q domain-containing protein [Candidatus Binatia bacterium]
MFEAERVGEQTGWGRTNRWSVSPWRGRAGLLALLVGAACLQAPAALAVCVVGSGTGASCTEAALTACLPGGGSFDGAVTFNCGGAATIVFTSTKTISSTTSIDGGGLVTLSGNDAVKLFVVTMGVTLSLDNLTVAKGRATGSTVFGGAIENLGTLNATNCTFSGNHAIASGGSLTNWALGGAINNGGTLTATNCTFAGNSATATGGTASTKAFGGAVMVNGGKATITGSTFDSNTTNVPSGFSVLSAGGAIYQTGQSLTVVNSTFLDNTVAGSVARGGGIYTESCLVSVTNCTLRQSSPNGVGNSLYAGNFSAFTVTNTIVAGSAVNCGSAMNVSIADGGHNIDDGTSCGFTGTDCSNTSGTSFCATNPQLDPAGLANNGGPTQTAALCTGAGSPAGCSAASPAIDTGNQTVCAAAPVNDLDQRGYARPGGANANCCIGAFEADSGPPALPSDTPTHTPTVTPSQSPSSTPTASPTVTPNATHTPTPQPNGDACADPAQCQSQFCVDGVCCDAACAAPTDRCDLDGQVGTCVSAAAPAPTLDRWGVAIGTILLGGVAALALRRRSSSP